MKKQIIAIALTAAFVLPAVHAEQVGSVIEFQTGTPAKAAEVNANFQTLIAAINDIDSRVSTIEQEASNSVAGQTYRLIAFYNEQAAESDADGVRDRAFTMLEGAGGTISFDVSNGSGVLTIGGVDSELNISNSGTINFEIGEDPAPAGGEGFTWSQSQDGSTVTVTFSDGDTFVAHLSANGQMFIGLETEQGQFTNEFGTTFDFMSRDVVIGVRQ